MPNKKRDAYAVGYGKPPKQHQFQAGQSGNPKGRPSGSKNARTLLQELLCQPITITENGRKKTVTKLEAAYMRLMSSALSGNMQALRQLIALLPLADAGSVDAEADQISPEQEAEILKQLLKRQIDKKDEDHE